MKELQTYRVEGQTKTGDPFAAFVAAKDEQTAREKIRKSFGGSLQGRLDVTINSWHDVEDILLDQYNVDNVYGEPDKTMGIIAGGEPFRLTPPYHTPSGLARTSPKEYSIPSWPSPGKGGI